MWRRTHLTSTHCASTNTPGCNRLLWIMVQPKLNKAWFLPPGSSPVPDWSRQVASGPTTQITCPTSNRHPFCLCLDRPHHQHSCAHALEVPPLEAEDWSLGKGTGAWVSMGFGTGEVVCVLVCGPSVTLRGGEVGMHAVVAPQAQVSRARRLSARATASFRPDGLWHWTQDDVNGGSTWMYWSTVSPSSCSQRLHLVQQLLWEGEKMAIVLKTQALEAPTVFLQCEPHLVKCGGSPESRGSRLTTCSIFSHPPYVSRCSKTSRNASGLSPSTIFWGNMWDGLLWGRAGGLLQRLLHDGLPCSVELPSGLHGPPGLPAVRHGSPNTCTSGDWSHCTFRFFVHFYLAFSSALATTVMGSKLTSHRNVHTLTGRKHSRLYYSITNWNNLIQSNSAK